MVQKFEFQKLELNGAYLIRPSKTTDNRGSFVKDYNTEIFKQNGIEHNIKEIFYTFSKKGTLRGIHFQLVKQQAKLVRCICGHVYDVIVDLRPNSSTFGQWRGFDLTQENMNMLLVPHYFGHGFLAVEDSIICYKCSEVFFKEGDSGIKFDDKNIDVKWPYELIGSKDNIIMSEKDKHLMSFNEYQKLLNNSTSAVKNFRSNKIDKTTV